jgi:hypothetical protein
VAPHVRQGGELGFFAGNPDEHLGVDLGERVRNVLQPGDPGAMRGYAAAPEQAVEGLHRIAGGTHDDERDCGVLGQDFASW